MKKLFKILLTIMALFLLTISISSARDNPSLVTNKEADTKNIDNEYYKISAGDRLEVVVYEENDLSGTFEVKEDGTISFPLLGTIQAGNLTKKEMEDKLCALLKDGYLVDPYVRVAVGKFGTRNILILGYVSKPGTYKLPEDGNPTILKAIVDSGGFTPMANINGTRIIRTLSNGKKVTINPRVGDIMSGRRQDIGLELGDLIVVPERLF